MELTDKIAVITGGTGSLGISVVKAFLQERANVITTYIEDEEFDDFNEKVRKFSNRCVCIKVDLFFSDEIEKLRDFVKEHFQRIDVLVNLAGGFIGGNSLINTPIVDFDKMYELNFKTAMTTCKVFLPLMIEQNYGKIINIGARAGLSGGAGIAAYSASKAALINFTQSIAAEVKKYNINVNIILPSTINTPANRIAMPEADFDKWVEPETIAKAILFLSSDDAKDISGAVLPVYGKA